MQKIVIIGAGPAGLLLAHYLLAQGGYELEIYERRPDPRSMSEQSQRSFPVVLQSRGLLGLDGIEGLKSIMVKEGVLSKGSVMHGKKGKDRSIRRSTEALIINRNQLTQVLLNELTKNFSNDRLTLRFDCNCVEVNQKEQRVMLNHAEEGDFSVGFDRLVGADGSTSQVRESLNRQNHLNAETALVADVYKSFSISRFSLDGTQELLGDSVHVWSMEKGVRLVMAPQLGDRLNGTLIFPPDKNPLADCQTGEEVLAYFGRIAPSMTAFMTVEEAHDLGQARISTLTTVKCDRLNIEDKVVLVGDAAHAVSPSIGQGCNSSLQDALIFNQVLNEHHHDWAQALPAYTQRRLADVHALRDLSDYTFPRSRLMGLEFIFRLTVGKKLSGLFPKIFTPLPMELVMETDQSYSSILNQCRRWTNNVRKSMVGSQ